MTRTHLNNLIYNSPNIPPYPTEEANSLILDVRYTIKTFGSSQFNKGLVAIQCEVISERRLNPQKC